MALSRFAGHYNATSFNYGGVDKDSPAPLVVVSAPGLSGAQTVITYGSTVALSDGTVITPLATTAPIIIGTDGNSETVTPSAVSNNVQSNTYGIVSTATATFSNAHYAGDRISSGTAGLQEALNYAASKGGGTVFVDQAWVLQGGTQAMLNAAVLGTNTSISDNRFGGDTQTMIIALSATQINTMFTTPVELLPAPGANAMYLIDRASLMNENAGTAWTSGGAIEIGYGSSVTTEALTGTIAATFLTSPVVNQVITLAGAQLASTTASTYLNQGIYINNATGVFATGTGVVKVKLQYSVLNL